MSRANRAMGLVEVMSEEEYADFLEMFFDAMPPAERVEQIALLREWYCEDCGRQPASVPEGTLAKNSPAHKCTGAPKIGEDEPEDADDADDEEKTT